MQDFDYLRHSTSICKNIQRITNKNSAIWREKVCIPPQRVVQTVVEQHTFNNPSPHLWEFLSVVGIISSRVGIIPSLIGIIPTRLEIIPTRLGIIPTRLGIIPIRLGIIPTWVLYPQKWVLWIGYWVLGGPLNILGNIGFNIGGTPKTQ